MVNINLFDCCGLCFLLRVLFRSLNFMSLIWLTIWLCLYPLCLSLFTSLHFIFSKFVSFEFVLRYLFVSPLLMALMVDGGWYDLMKA